MMTVYKPTRLLVRIHKKPVAPVAWVIILEPGMGQFHEFESPRVRTCTKFVGTFSSAQIDLRKAREREYATVDEQWDC